MELIVNQRNKLKEMSDLMLVGPTRCHVVVCSIGEIVHTNHTTNFKSPCLNRIAVYLVFQWVFPQFYCVFQKKVLIWFVAVSGVSCYINKQSLKHWSHVLISSPFLHMSTFCCLAKGGKDNLDGTREFMLTASSSRNLKQPWSRWWFQPIWKILVKLDHFPR